jgi:hypothetical protein
MCNKKCYSQKGANNIVNKLSRRTANRKKTNHLIPKRAYFCSECNAYHLTSQPDWKDFKPIKNRKYERKRNPITSLEIQRELDSL